MQVDQRQIGSSTDESIYVEQAQQLATRALGGFFKSSASFRYFA